MKTRCLRTMKMLSVALMGMAILALPGSGRAVDATSDLKVDLPLRLLLQQPAAGKAMLGKAIAVRGGTEQVDVLIKSSNIPATRDAITAAGGEARAAAGDILTAFVPVGAVAELSARPEVSGIEASKQLRLLMDTARSADNTNVVAVQGAGFEGKNVVVGVIDSGLDYSRTDFASSAGGTRVQYLRFQTAGKSSLSVTECAKDTIDAGNCSIKADNDAQVGHGTHVTGIAAGGDATYTGVAPAADIFMVRNDYTDDLNEGNASSGTFSGGVIDGVTQIFTKADILDKPAVVNLSQGTHIGAHDNTSLLEQAMNAAVTGGYATGGKAYGRAVVAAAGNEHIVDAALGDLAGFAGGIHATINVAAGKANAWRLWVLDASSPTRTPLVLDLWFGAGQKDNCSVAANIYHYLDLFGASLAPAATLTTSHARAAISDMPLSASGQNDNTTADGAASILAITDPADTQNSRPRALLQFGPTATTWDAIAFEKTDTTTNTTPYLLDVIVRAGSGACTGDLWMEGGGSVINFMKGVDTGAYDMGAGTHGAAYAVKSGDNQKIVTIPATASGVIAVGSYLQEKPASGCPSQSCWTDSSGVLHDATDPTTADASNAEVNGGTVGSRSPFSSTGPAAYSYSGRKPDVLAPGDPIISVLPTGHSVDPAVQVNDTHYKSQGTSEASPQVAGLVALLFSKNNRLTADQAKAAITGSASLANNPNDNDGFGNILAPAAMAKVAADTTGFSGTGNLKQSDLGGGGGSSGGCGGQLVPAAAGNALPQAAAILVPLLFLALRRRRR